MNLSSMHAPNDPNEVLVTKVAIFHIKTSLFPHLSTLLGSAAFVWLSGLAAMPYISLFGLQDFRREIYTFLNFLLDALR